MWGKWALMLTLSPQGTYVFAVYFIMHNQLCWPTKASYTVETSGREGPDSSYQGGGPTSAGGDINKSTQNLISAMEEVKLRHARWHTPFTCPSEWRKSFGIVFPICFCILLIWLLSTAKNRSEFLDLITAELQMMVLLFHTLSPTTHLHHSETFILRKLMQIILNIK